MVSTYKETNTIKYNYLYEDYISDIGSIYEKNKELVNPHIVGIYRGSLPIAVHLSNLFKCPMSIIKFQAIDGNDKEPVFLFDNIKDDSDLIIVDDIYDSGTTMRIIKPLLDNKQSNSIKYMTLFGYINPDDVEYIHENIGKWVVFPWERVNEDV